MNFVFCPFPPILVLPLSFRTSYLWMVVPIGMLTSLDISLSNTSLIYIPISLYTTVKASVLVYTFAFRYFTLLLSCFFNRIIYYFRWLPNSLQFCQMHDIIIFSNISFNFLQFPSILLTAISCFYHSIVYMNLINSSYLIMENKSPAQFYLFTTFYFLQKHM